MFIGHQNLVKDFKNLVKNNCLAHGYIFFGEPEVGKFYFAKHLANFLENGGFSAKGGPALGWELSYRPLQDALILENASGIGAMREIKNFLWQKPAVSRNKIVVLDNAENLTPEAQNAILKITEEPPESAILILIASRLDNLLPPLLSRLQKIYFGRLSDSEIGEIELLKAKSSKLKAEIISSSFGRPGRAARLTFDPITKEAQNYVRNFLKMTGYQRSALIKDLVENQKDKPELLDYFFEELILELKNDIMRNAPLLKSVLNRFFLIKSYNVNKRIQIEAI